MNRETKLRIAKELFSHTKMTKEQYETFKALAEELDLTVGDADLLTDSEMEQFIPQYINK